MILKKLFSSSLPGSVPTKDLISDAVNKGNSSCSEWNISGGNECVVEDGKVNHPQVTRFANLNLVMIRPFWNAPSDLERGVFRSKAAEQ